MWKPCSLDRSTSENGSRNGKNDPDGDKGYRSPNTEAKKLQIQSEYTNVEEDRRVLRKVDPNIVCRGSYVKIFEAQSAFMYWNLEHMMSQAFGGPTQCNRQQG